MTKAIKKDAPALMFEEILKSFLKYENESKAKIVKAAMQRKAENGYCPFRPPLGYSKTTKPGLFAINRQGRAMAELLNKYADGKITSTELHYSLSFVFNPLPKGISTKHSLCDYLSNPYYEGYVLYKNNKYKGRHQAMLSEEKLTKIITKLYTEIREEF